MAGTVRVSLAEARRLCERAAAANGASAATAAALADAAVAAEAEGQPAVGLGHFLDYLDALKAGRLKGGAEPVLSRPAPAVILSDAGGGAAHTGFAAAAGSLVRTARRLGLALFVQRNAFTCGELGYFVRRLAAEGLAGLAATNGPALMAPAGVPVPVYCTNPLAFAAPRAGGPPLLIDQSSSAAAFVAIREAARDGRALPEGWAIGPDGSPTTDAAQALKGALVAFGGSRGANLALMVEVLAAGLSGANWSLDAPPFDRGGEPPGTGLFVLALKPDLADPRFADRLGAQLDRLAGLGVHVPGARRGAVRHAAESDGIDVPGAILERIAAEARPAAEPAR